MKRDLLTILDLAKEDISYILKRAGTLKDELRRGITHKTLSGKTMAMIFKKPSTRTRVSFETGLFQLGGLALDLNRESLQIGRGESIHDTARVLSRYVDIILIRTHEQEEVEILAKHAGIPVINGLTDLFHPCQILSDLFTIEENRGTLSEIRIVYIGDGNNVAHSWLNAAAVLGLKLCLACPPGFAPDRVVLERTQRLASQTGGNILISSAPEDAVRDANIIYSDVWISMGQEKEADERRRRFMNYQINKRLLDLAPPDTLVMHCLPAHRGEEITDEVLDGPNSIVFDQAENRLHVQKAIMEALVLGMKGKIDVAKDR